MEYSPLEKTPYYAECQPLVSAQGCELVEFKVTQVQNQYRVKAVIASQSGVGINECAKVHRMLLSRLEALLQTQDVYMEVTSPGVERLLKNASEFSVFIGKIVRVWDARISDWVVGTILSSDAVAVTLSILQKDESKKTNQTSETDAMCIPFEYIAKAKLCNT